MKGSPRRTIELVTQAISLDPKHAHEGDFLAMAWAYLQLGDNDAAIEWSLKSSEKNPGLSAPYNVLAMAYALKGEDAKARAAAAESRRLDPSVNVIQVAERLRRPTLPSTKKFLRASSFQRGARQGCRSSPARRIHYTSAAQRPLWVDFGRSPMSVIGQKRTFVWRAYG